MKDASQSLTSTIHSTNDDALSLSIETIFAQSGQELSTDRIKKILDQAIAKIKQNNTDPDRLVRVVSKGKVLWMTIDQAKDYLINNEDPALNEHIEEALKGDISIIKNEMKFLLALSHYTLEQYHSQQSLSTQDLNQLKPSLEQYEQEINKNLGETVKNELILNEKLNSRPLIDQYEQLMSKFVELKDKTGYHTIASAIADQLKKQKSNYLRYVRAIEPDLQRVNQGRVSLQLSKKSILQTQNNINSIKQASLQMEIDELKEKLILLNPADSQSDTPTAVFFNGKLNQAPSTEYSRTKKYLMNKEEEHKALHLSDQILRQQQNTISNVVRKILKDVFNTDQPPRITALPINEEIERSPLPELEHNIKKIKQGMHYQSDRVKQKHE